MDDSVSMVTGESSDGKVTFTFEYTQIDAGYRGRYVLHAPNQESSTRWGTIEGAHDKVTLAALSDALYVLTVGWPKKSAGQRAWEEASDRQGVAFSELHIDP